MTVEMTIPAMHVRKGEMMLRLGLGMPGQARAHRVTAITATDSRGAIALEAPSGMVAEWHAPRDVEGDVHVRYTLALERLPMLPGGPPTSSAEHTSELQSLMRIPSAVFCLKQKNK